MVDCPVISSYQLMLNLCKAGDFPAMEPESEDFFFVAYTEIEAVLLCEGLHNMDIEVEIDYTTHKIWLHSEDKDFSFVNAIQYEHEFTTRLPDFSRWAVFLTAPEFTQRWIRQKSTNDMYKVFPWIDVGCDRCMEQHMINVAKGFDPR